MKKNLIKLSIILAMLLLTLIPLSANAETIDSGTCTLQIKWTLSDDGTLTLTGTGEIPDYHQYLPFVPWYEHNSDIKSIIIEDGITNISNSLFKDCTNLTTVTISKTVVEIDENAFYNCKSIEYITLPNSLSYIENYTFYGCDNLKSVTLGENVVSIGACSFYNCINLTDVKLSNTIKIINNNAFYGCENIKNVYINSIDSWLGVSFYNEFSNPMYYGENMYIDGELATKITLPYGTKVIKPYTFKNWKTLSEVHMYYNNIETVGNSAFKGCTNLLNVNGIGSIKNIDDDAFYNCQKLRGLPISSNTISIGDRAFYNCDSLSEVIISDKVTYVGKSAFSNCDNLLMVNIGNKLTKIEESTFRQCKNLTSLSLGTNIEIIDGYAFYECEKLNDFTFPERVTTIGTYSFYYCENLSIIKIPKSLTKISYGAFSWCTNIKKVYYNGYSADWKKITIDSGNQYLKNAKLLFLPITLTIQKNDNKYLVTPTGVENGNIIIFTCYFDNKMVYLEPFTYAGEENKTFTPDKEYDTVKVFVWENFETCMPLCEAEELTFTN